MEGRKGDWLDLWYTFHVGLGKEVPLCSLTAETLPIFHRECSSCYHHTFHVGLGKGDQGEGRWIGFLMARVFPTFYRECSSYYPSTSVEGRGLEEMKGRWLEFRQLSCQIHLNSLMARTLPILHRECSGCRQFLPLRAREGGWLDLQQLPCLEHLRSHMLSSYSYLLQSSSCYPSMSGEGKGLEGRKGAWLGLQRLSCLVHLRSLMARALPTFYRKHRACHRRIIYEAP